jgi:hypothetical protein
LHQLTRQAAMTGDGWRRRQRLARLGELTTEAATAFVDEHVASRVRIDGCQHAFERAPVTVGGEDSAVQLGDLGQQPPLLVGVGLQLVMRMRTRHQAAQSPVRSMMWLPSSSTR